MSAVAAEARIEDAVDHAPHRTVLVREVTALIGPRPGGVYVDATLGAGGHAAALLEGCSPNGRVVGFDRDPGALETAKRRLAPFGDRFTTIHGDYGDIVTLLRDAGIYAVDGIVADLGVSSMQLDDPARGFSFRADGPLDMRMDPSSETPTAADLLATLPESELRRILREYGEEKLAAPIARAIIRRRGERPFERTRELAELVERIARPSARHSRIHPATRTFQALRIVVNGEVEGLSQFVCDAVSLLRRGARFAAISFHSLEDRAVKHALRGLAERCVCPPGLPVCGCGRENIVRIVTPRPIVPSAEECDANPRSRSARLRAAERI
jgi:16S rRNA (cytosine1402-N4)-methyltransferase